MKITRVRAYPLNATWELYFGGKEKVPAYLYKPSANFMLSPRRGQHITLVEITAENGVSGYGECFGIPDARYTAQYVEEYFKPMLIDKDPMDIERLWDGMMFCAQGIGNTAGPMMEAISGIDIALWDLKGKLLNKPVHELLGAKKRDRIYCYATPIMLFEKPEQTVARALELLDMGFSAIKLKVGRGIKQDLLHLEAVRKAVPSTVRILLDNNCGYDGKVDEAIEFSNAAKDYDVFWFEEPVSPDDLAAYARIRENTSIPMATGENDFTFNGFKRLIDSGSIEYIMPNLGRAGGISGVVKINRYASQHGVKLSPHGVNSGIGILAAISVMSVFENATIFEANQLLNPLRHELMKNQFEYADGYIHVDDEPGLGIDIDWRTVRKYIADGWCLHEHAEE